MATRVPRLLCCGSSRWLENQARTHLRTRTAVTAVVKRRVSFDGLVGRCHMRSLRVREEEGGGGCPWNPADWFERIHLRHHSGARQWLVGSERREDSPLVVAAQPVTGTAARPAHRRRCGHGILLASMVRKAAAVRPWRVHVRAPPWGRHRIGAARARNFCHRPCTRRRAGGAPRGMNRMNVQRPPR